MARYIADIETDSLKPTKIHCLVLKDIDTGEILEFASGLGRRPIIKGVRLLQAADYSVWHNGLWFDVPVLNKFYPEDQIDPNSVIDTLVVSRLLNSWDYSKHSLEEWGVRLGYPKGVFSAFEELTEQMITYCVRDVNLTHELFTFFSPGIFHEDSAKSMRLEHRTAVLYRTMHENGFGFNKARALELQKEILENREVLDVAIQKAFPPKPVLIRVIEPKLTSKGKLSLVPFKFLPTGDEPEKHGYHPNAPFSRIDYEEFNPGSPQQVIERLHDFGWAPTEKTKGHIVAERERDYEKLKKFQKYGWKVSEENIETLPETAPPEAKTLVRWLLLNSRVTTLQTWIDCFDETTGRIHGEVRPIGTWTHRVSHKNPNTGNICRVNFDKQKQILWGEEGVYGADFRSLWTSSPGWKLVGCDAEGIQLRVLAHYMEDEEFTRALVAGKSDEGTDVHTLNMKKLNSEDEVCKNRDVAKTFVYSWVLGASTTKTAAVLNCTVRQASVARRNFLEGYPGLKRVKEELIPADVSRGLFTGLDGRRVLCDSAHLMLAGYLQNGEAVVMKTANVLFDEMCKKEGVYYKQVNFVHDEIIWETETEEEAKLTGSFMEKAIEEAGILLNMKCPLKGKAKIGNTWLDTH